METNESHENRENPIFGRKVFFLNPPLSVENNIVENLKNDEYEVYVISDYTLAKPVLRLYENAICFIFIDDVLSLDGWYNYIKSFEKDDTLQTIFLGALSIKTKPEVQKKFLMDLKLPGGFVMLDKKNEKVFQQLEGILELNGAKGRRKCIRLEIKNKEVNGYFAYGSLLYSFTLVDISEVGFAAVTPVKMAPIFQKGGVVQNVSLTMGRYSFVCSINIYNVKITDNNCFIVAMFAEDTKIEIKKKIHNFVFETLKARNLEIQQSVIKDLEDYSIKPKESSADDVALEEINQIADVDYISDDVSELPDL